MLELQASSQQVFFPNPTLSQAVYIFSLPTMSHACKTCEAKPQNKICHGRTLTQLCQIHIKITRCAARCNKGQGGGVTHTALSKALPSLLSPPPLASPLPSSLTETCAHAVPPDSLSSQQLMHSQLLFSPFPFLLLP